MKILHYLPSLDTARGGPVRAVFDLCAGLAARGHAVTLLTTERTDAPAAWDGSDATLPRVILLEGGMVQQRPFSRAQRDAARAILERHDILHVHAVWELSNAQLAADARRMAKPYFISLRGMLDDWPMAQKRLKKRLMHAFLIKRHLERAAAVHCTAQGELDQSRKWFPKGRGVVIPNLLDLSPFRKPPGPALARQKWPQIANGLPTVLFLSRLHIKKGVEILLRACAAVRARGLDHHLVLAGSGDERYTRRMQEVVRELKLEDRTVFTGHINGDLKISLYQAASLLALPTSQENFGFVFPEALASGTPVITTKGVDIWPELLESGAAVLAEPTPEAFAHAMDAVLRDPARLAALAANAKPFALRAFDERSILDRFEAMYGCGARPRP